MSYQAGESRRKTKIQRFSWLIWVAVILVLAAGAYLTWQDYYSRIFRSASVEIGTAPLSAEVFRRRDGVNLSFANDAEAQAIDTSVLGTHEVKIRSDLFTYRCELKVIDTTPPQAEILSKEIPYGKKLNAEDFVGQITDATEVKVGYVRYPDFETVGLNTVELELWDQGDNHSFYETTVFIDPLLYYLEMTSDETLELDDFIAAGLPKDQLSKITAITDLATVAFEEPGEHEVILSVNGVERKALVKLADTTPPLLELKPVEGWLGIQVAIEDFIETLQDVSDVKLSYMRDPDLKQPGLQEVTIQAEDAYGNISIRTTTLTLLRDEDPPVIEGVEDLIVMLGTSVDYLKNVTAKDNKDEAVDLTVNTELVDLNQLGTYPVVYKAADKAGNVTITTAIVKVVERIYTDEDAAEAANTLLESMIEPEMTDENKLLTIYSWVHGNLTEEEQDNHEEWQRAACEGITLRKGDSYVFAMTSRALLTGAGIKNMIIQAEGPQGTHWWNLVDLGDGWHHFDAVPLEDGQTVMYLTDEELMAISVLHGNIYNYDHTKYPDVVR